ncbi:hypothetical protein CDD80_112 [Ophiocordyceps camponoti-rufipedis]|uniref:Protein BIG1 n=1 Tax=Ophiocordyceps camponoti-rufipedis TaxID=2004952 RepID=A0A2C5YHP9_9HYPO|nr:hypothetical protein CDD80_112 [Ophiocordyceps camponoti-rufipedis]
MRSLLALVLLLAAAASARSYVQPSDAVLTSRDAVLLPYVSFESPDGLLIRRQAGGQQPAGGPVQLTPDKGANNDTNFDKAANAACIEALKKLPKSTNPSGNCLCYNLPSLDTNTGSFTADLRVFRVSEPRDNFAGIAPGEINVGVQYDGATVTLASPEQTQQTLSQPIGRRQLQARPEPEIIQSYMFIGQINPDRMNKSLALVDLEPLVTPKSFKLSAKDKTGGTVSTEISFNEASFLVGVFSDQVVQSDFGAAQAAVDEKKAAVRNGTAAFVLPGVQIMIFPVGLIITSVWVIIGTTAYGIGTYQRALYAKAWRQRTRVAAQVAGRSI